MSDIHHINLAGIDLNLLVVFDALMTEQNVTRAGVRVGLSQPATSNALARLRNLTKDVLFIRTAAGIRPTPTAIVLHQKLRPTLQQIQSVLLEKSIFDPEVSDRTFAIGMSDNLGSTLLPNLMHRLQALAPRISVQIRAGNRQKLLSLLDDGQLDLVCGVFHEKIAWHREHLLFKEDFVCVCRKDHPVIQKTLSLDEYLSVSHLLISLKEDRIGLVDSLLSKRDLKRHIALSTPHFLTAPFILEKTDLIATMARRVAINFAYDRNLNLKLFPLPFSLPGFSVFMRWHQSTESSPACQWLRMIVLEVGRTVDNSP